MRWILCLAFPIGAAFASPAGAQLGTVRSVGAPQVPAQGAPMPGLSAEAFQALAVMVNLFEVEASKLVLARGRDEELEILARRIVRDGEEVLGHLGRAGAPLERDLDQEQTQALSDLRNSEGILFDRRYLQEQIRLHQQAIQLYERYAESGSDAEMKAIAEQGLPSARQNLRSASEVMGRFIPGD